MRLLPPLNVSEAEVREGDGDAGKGRRGAGKAEGGSPMNAPLKVTPKHFLDLSDHDTATLRAIIEDAKARKAARGRAAPRAWPMTTSR